MAERFQMGEAVTLRVEFKTPKTATPPSELINPTLVTLRIQLPDKTIENRTFGVDDIDNPSVGIFLAPLSLDQEGTYYWRWTGSNGITVKGVKSGVLDSVREPNF